jgi:hypothetical protein
MGDTVCALGKRMASILHDTGVRGRISCSTSTRGEVAVLTPRTPILVAVDCALHATGAREEVAPLVQHRLLR